MVDRIRSWPTWKVVALFVAPYVVVVGTGSLALLRFETEDKQDQLDSCIGRHDSRVGFARLVNFVVDQPNTTGSLDLTQVPGFEDLDSAIQTYLINLSAALSGADDDEDDDSETGRSPREQALVDFVEENLPAPDCEALAEELDINLPKDFVQYPTVRD